MKHSGFLTIKSIKKRTIVSKPLQRGKASFSEKQKYYFLNKNKQIKRNKEGIVSFFYCYIKIIAKFPIYLLNPHIFNRASTFILSTQNTSIEKTLS